MANTKTELTAEQLAALRTFAHQHGRTWKAVLRDAWFSGNYPHSADENSDALLQQVRNTFGPSWLLSFRLEGGR